jgi:hypothetical protein
MKDIDGMVDLEEKVWPKGLRATKEQFISRIETFPEGIFVAILDDKVVGTVVTEIIKYDLLNAATLTWKEITDNGFIRKSHNPWGDTLYGVNLSALPKTDAAKLLMQEVGKLAVRLNLKRGVLGARIPRYHRVANRIAVEDYVNGRKGNRPMDPELVVYTRLGLKITKIIPYYIDDSESCDFGILMVWDNPFYGKPFPRLWSKLFGVK